MPKMIDLTGQKFGRWTVIGPAPCPKTTKFKEPHWLCKCSCGESKIVRGSNLRNGRTQSCGCLKKQNKHGQIKTRLYRIYNAMKTRCYNKHSKAYKNYGERGIAICDDWLNKETGFVNFYNWSISHGYADNLSIDRIDGDKGYSPDNCRWADSITQNRNRKKRKD
ncbi:MAG: hypothetical protein IKV53_07195 [Clostridia bacterium]|nr:hypothetical protein [Clostridia bacterium]